MRSRRFLDTNVLVYAFAAGDRRSVRAEALLAEGGVIGVQVLNEFTNVARRNLAWSWEQVEAALGVIDELVGPARPAYSPQPIPHHSHLSGSAKMILNVLPPPVRAS